MRIFPVLLTLAFASFPFLSVAQTGATSHLDTVSTAKQVRVCIWPDYFGIRR